MKEIKKTVLVTGGAKRIGAAIVRDLAAHGYAVAIHCHQSRKAAEILAGSILRDGGAAEVFTSDLSSTEPGALVEQVAAKLGPPGVLVNNASVFTDDMVTSIEPEIWDRHFSLHVKAPVLLTGAFARALPDSANGLVVNIIDQRVWRLTPGFFSYTLSKSALWTATQTMAQALAPRIRVNAIGPGPTMANERQTPDDFAAQSSAVPLGHGPGLGEFGKTIRWMIDSPSVTGQMIALDGGQHLAWRTPDVTGVRE